MEASVLAFATVKVTSKVQYRELEAQSQSRNSDVEGKRINSSMHTVLKNALIASMM